jgi:UrcA family protein
MRIVKATRRSPRWAAALASAACLLAVGAASAAQAPGNDATMGPGNDATMVTQYARVSFRDLDLSTPAGAQKLYVRIEHAAHQVCDDEFSADLHRAARSRKCCSNAIAHAVSDVHSPQLTALYNSKSRKGTKLTAMSQE